MRIGLYGMPTAGKSYIMERIDFMPSFNGSKLLREMLPDFDAASESDLQKVTGFYMMFLSICIFHRIS